MMGESGIVPGQMKRPKVRRGELEQAVFLSVYRSRSQRGLRVLAAIVLAAKHMFRGLLFSWPVYALAVAGWFSDGWLKVLLWSLAIPGIGLSLIILYRGIREEYRTRVVDQLLANSDLVRLIGKAVR